MEGESRYCVLYTRVPEMKKAMEAIRRNLPKTRGIVFSPQAEFWQRGYERYVLRPLFPGYLFLRSDMGRREIHELIKKSRSSTDFFVKELSEAEQWEEELFELTRDEEEFLDRLMCFGERTQGRPDDAEPGIIRMSRGYMEAGKCIVMEGPLRGQEEQIADIRKRDRKAYLKLSVNGHYARAGLELFGKRHYFPEDKDAPDLLADGTEADMKQLAKAMMRG